MITSNFKIRSISEKKDATCPEKTDIGAKSVAFTEMRNAVFGVKNDKFSEKDLDELQNKILSKKNRVKASEADFGKKNHEYESNKNIWKDTKVSTSCIYDGVQKWGVSLHCSVRNSGQMTIGKTHSTLKYYM